jgi:ferredoxin
MCGPDGFMDVIKGILRVLDFDLANLHSESFGGLRTAKARRPQPKPEEQGIAVRFARSGVAVQTDGKINLLELAEESDIDIEYACRSGSCGECRVKLLSGEVDAESDDGLSEEEIAEGYVLTCVATPKGDVVLDV